MFKINNTETRCRSGVFIVNFDFILPLFQVSIVEFEQANVCWVIILK